VVSKKTPTPNGNSLQGVVGGLGGKHTLVERHGVFETLADQQRQVFFPAKMNIFFFNRKKHLGGCWQNPYSWFTVANLMSSFFEGNLISNFHGIHCEPVSPAGPKEKSWNKFVKSSS